MPLKCLTKRFATLMRILSGQRSQTMSLVNNNHMYIAAVPNTNKRSQTWMMVVLLEVLYLRIGQ